MIVPVRCFTCGKIGRGQARRVCFESKRRRKIQRKSLDSLGMKKVLLPTYADL